MAGPQDIQRVPRGLIDLLGMRATGQTPAQLDATVNGQIELLEFYLNERFVIATQTGSIVISPGLTGFNSLTVPNGQLWLLYQMTFSSVSSAAGTGAICTGGITRQYLTGGNYFALTNVFEWGPLAQLNIGANFTRPVIMQPGDQVNLRTSAILTAAPSVAPICHIYYAALGI
jgi:hypothetical protein